MRFRAIIVGLIFWCATSVHAQVPKIGTDTTLDICNWNIEWFGDSINGPSNENTQLNNAVTVLKSMDMDIYGLCEISNPGYWQKLQDALPGYGAAITTYSQTQKTALLYKKSMFRMLYVKSILLAFDFEFASGRFPLEVALEWDNQGKKDTLYCWVIHLKANTGSTSEKQSAYDRRAKAAEELKKYIDAKKRWKGVVLGDWNDDLDISIFSSKASPFLAWRNDTNYIFPTYRLSLNRSKSTASYAEMIDHQVLTPRLKWHWNRSSSGVLVGDAYIGSYRYNTSDHYPVWSRLNFTSTEPSPEMNNEEFGTFGVGDRFPVYWSNGAFVATGILGATLEDCEITVRDVVGRELMKTGLGEQVELASGIYFLQIKKNNLVKLGKIWIP